MLRSIIELHETLGIVITEAEQPERFHITEAKTKQQARSPRDFRPSPRPPTPTDYRSDLERRTEEEQKKEIRKEKNNAPHALREKKTKTGARTSLILTRSASSFFLYETRTEKEKKKAN
ncbi:hypothetical protein COCVIDRAFT_20390 [Bipolaris victoriae FI3]|uniref:Uncharacterized protein n=1 Tax=Bipolaris victoriae (strain FI3) TaxID=930091 RepID=W7E709_BIPV3|nr:hypothetical protein COCVIDRAFT_20390 [Bipolaris victoriae FI3]